MGRTIVRGFINGSMKPLSEIGLENKIIKRVWTIIDENMYRFNPKTGKETTLDSDESYLEHLGNVFLEDKFHDWRVSGEQFHFFGHSGSKGQIHDLIIEWQ